MKGINPDAWAAYEVANEIIELLYERCEKEGFSEAHAMTVMTGVVTMFFEGYKSRESARRRFRDLCHLAGMFIDEHFTKLN